ncbi:unnamed protein product [Jaminaea pallidilutea]
MSAPASNSASPAPSGPSYLELYNQHDAPKPFKKVATYSTSSTGRKRNLKQILAAEQDAAFELGAAVAGREGKKRRRDHKKKSAQTDDANGTGGSAFSGTSASGSRLIGAAAKAAQKRQERLKREAAAAAEADAATSREESVDDNADETGDVTMKTDVAADESLPPTEAPTGGIATPAAVPDEQAQAEQQERIRKMNLPTYLSVEAPPSLRPAKKYCDVTGLLAPYTDPKTSLRYHSAEIYEVIKTFAPGIDQAYLALRGRHQALM